ncbi:MAG TPA: response regulator [Gemmataceae bacterium]|jgi:CheY-like chemotaxis protein|nr:response regulator [Gemmataceae bacterium]
MATVLVVDDSAVDRLRAEKLLSKDIGLSVRSATNGKEALHALAQELPDVVITDMQMPEMDGLELVEAIRSKYPAVPVILMTAHGSEELAVHALQRGAASYVPKRNLARDLPETIDSVLGVSKANLGQQRLLECLIDTQSHFVLENDASLIPSLIGHLENNLTRMKLCDENGLIRVAVAMREALINAIHHGNLEISSSLREKDDKEYSALVEERRQLEPYQDRRVHVYAKESHHEAYYVIRDEGRGFDPTSLPDPTDPANLENVSGRGLLLIRTFMDEVHHNKTGNEITMIKRCDR